MEEKSTKGQILFAVFGVIVLILSIAGSAYAYYVASVTSDPNDIQGEAMGSLDNITIDIERMDNASGKLIPISSGTSTLSKAAKGWNTQTNALGTEWNDTYACIDKNGYSVCQIYHITITNNNNRSDTYNISLNLTATAGSSIPSMNAVKMQDIITVASVTSVLGNNKLGSGVVIDSNQSTDMYVMIYYKNSPSAVQTDSGSFNGIVTVQSVNGGTLSATLS